LTLDLERAIALEEALWRTYRRFGGQLRERGQLGNPGAVEVSPS